MIRCDHCGAETSNGLALCDLCQQYARSCFEFLPVYFRNLARWRPGRTGSRAVPGSRVLYDGIERGTGTGDRISDTLDATANALTTWARVLVDARPGLARLLDRLSVARSEERIDEAQAVAWLCAGFDRWLASIATTDWCGSFVREIGEHETRLRRLTVVAVPGWYAGSCRHCNVPTYVVPGLSWVTCGSCGTTTHVQAHIEVIIDEARDWVARPKELARAIVALVDTEASVPRLYDRIRKWSEREQLEPIRRTVRGYAWDDATDRFVVADEEVGHARYRLGDVLDLVHATRRAALTTNGTAAS